jgi:hypothetical protein
MRSAIASRQAPQSVPAPQQAPTASTLRAPALTAASISRSVTARQMQRTIGARQAILRVILNINIDYQRRPARASTGKHGGGVTNP